ncbi:hypothetical protein ACGFZS_38605 [Streptomyces sp. NPDC048288]|uniref:hypothetical protein n=1 Tax=Streptomyces sp. NPDC048288 TaxID=3365529 RepID=UPI0037106AE9
MTKTSVPRNLTAALTAALLTAAAATVAAPSAAAVTLPACSSTDDSTPQKDALHSLPNQRGVVVLKLDTSVNSLPTELHVGSWTVPVSWVPTGTANTWQTDGPIHLDAYGTWSAYVEAPIIKSPGLSTMLRGDVDYTVQPVVQAAHTDLAASDADHRTVTVSGKVLGRDPYTGQLQPYTGLATVRWLDETEQDPNAVDAQLAADGSFSQPITVAGGAWITVTGNPGTDAAAHVSGTAFCKLAPGLGRIDGAVRLDAKTSASPVDSGATVTLSGKATWTEQVSPYIVHPLAGRTLQVTYSDGGSTPAFSGSVVTGADGSYSVQLTVSRPGTFSIASAAEAPYFTNSWGDATQQVRMPLSITGFKAALGADHKVTASGKLAATESRSPGLAGEAVDLEYSANGRTGWTRVATGKAAADGSFTSGAANRTSGWYRAHHRASTTYQDQVTSALKQSRTASRVTSLKITPQPVTKGKTLTVKGLLQHNTTAWKAYGGQRVAVLFRATGTTTWKTVTTVTTNSTGHFTAKPKATKDGTWVIDYAGNNTHFASRSAQDFVDVH